MNSTMRWLPAAVAAAGLALSGLSGFADETESIKISPEASKKIEVPDGVKKIYISNPSIIDARPEDEGFAVLVTGIKPGKAELRISRLLKEDLVYKVEVEPALKELSDEVAMMVDDIEGINVKIVGDKIVLDGELLTKRAQKRAEEVAAAFQGRVINLTTIDLVGYNRVVKLALEKEIDRDTVEVKVDGDRLLITGYVRTMKDLDRVKEIAKRHTDNATIMLMVLSR